MRRTETRKKQGKFIKSNSPLEKVVRITTYSFQEISGAVLADTDNANHNVIHRRFHRDEDVDGRIGHPTKLDTVHVDPMNPNQEIIFPRDFTKDWIEAKSKSKRRDELADVYYDDDDDDEDELPEQTSVQDREGEVSVEAASVGDSLQAESSEGSDFQETPVGRQFEPNLRPNANALEDMRNPGLGLEKIETFSPPEESDPNDSLVIKKPDLGEDPVHPTPGDLDEWQVVQGQDPEQSYEDIHHQEIDPKVQEDLLQMTKVASEIFEELSDLKQRTFENLQKNFEVMLEALGESVLKKKLSKDPKAMESLIHRAIADGVKEDTYKVFVDRQGFELLRSQGSDLEKFLQVDDSLDFGSFRVESDLAKVAGGIKDIVSDFIEQNDIDIYSDEES